MVRSMRAHRPTSCTSLLLGLPHRRSSALGEFALSLCERRHSLLNSHKCADAPQLFLCAARRHIAESGLELLAPLADTRRQSQGTSLCSLLRRRRLLVSGHGKPQGRANLLTAYQTIARYAFPPSHTSIDTRFPRLTLRARYAPNPVSATSLRPIHRPRGACTLSPPQSEKRGRPLGWL